MDEVTDIIEEFIADRNGGDTEIVRSFRRSDDCVELELQNSGCLQIQLVWRRLPNLES